MTCWVRSMRNYYCELPLCGKLSKVELTFHGFFLSCRKSSKTGPLSKMDLDLGRSREGTEQLDGEEELPKRIRTEEPVRTAELFAKIEAHIAECDERGTEAAVGWVEMAHNSKSKSFTAQPSNGNLTHSTTVNYSFVPVNVSYRENDSRCLLFKDADDRRQVVLIKELNRKKNNQIERLAMLEAAGAAGCTDADGKISYPTVTPAVVADAVARGAAVGGAMAVAALQPLNGGMQLAARGQVDLARALINRQADPPDLFTEFNSACNRAGVAPALGQNVLGLLMPGCAGTLPASPYVCSRIDCKELLSCGHTASPLDGDGAGASSSVASGPPPPLPDAKPAAITFHDGDEGGTDDENAAPEAESAKDARSMLPILEQLVKLTGRDAAMGALKNMLSIATTDIGADVMRRGLSSFSAKRMALPRRRIGARRAASSHEDDYWKNDPEICMFVKEFERVIAGSVVAIDQAGTGGAAGMPSAPKQQFALVIAAPAPSKPTEMNHDIDVAGPLQLLFEVATNGPRLSADALCMLLTSSVNQHYMTERTVSEFDCTFKVRVIAAVSSFAFRFRHVRVVVSRVTTRLVFRPRVALRGGDTETLAAGDGGARSRRPARAAKARQRRARQLGPAVPSAGDPPRRRGGAVGRRRPHRVLAGHDRGAEVPAARRGREPVEQGRRAQAGRARGCPRARRRHAGRGAGHARHPRRLLQHRRRKKGDQTTRNATAPNQTAQNETMNKTTRNEPKRTEKEPNETNRKVHAALAAARLPQRFRIVLMYTTKGASPDRMLSSLACYQRNFVHLADLTDVVAKCDAIMAHSRSIWQPLGTKSDQAIEGGGGSDDTDGAPDDLWGMCGIGDAWPEEAFKQHQ